MLNINYEFRKGILFIRFNGHLTVETSSMVKKELFSESLKKTLPPLVPFSQDVTGRCASAKHG